MDPHVCWKLYPEQYEEWIVIRDDESVFFRPVKPSDGPLIEDLFSKLSPPSIYFRFLSHLDRLRPEILYNLVHIDYECEFALTATIQEKGRETIVAVCRYVCTFDPRRVEPAVVVRDDWQGKGVGRVLVERFLRIAEGNGMSTIELRIDTQNRASKKLFRSLGYPYTYTKPIMWEPNDFMEMYLCDKEKNNVDNVHSND